MVDIELSGHIFRLYFFLHFDGNADDYADSIQEKKNFRLQIQNGYVHARAMFHSVIYQLREKRKMRATTCQMAASNWQYLKSLAAKNGQASDNAFGMCTLASQSAPHFWTDICNQNVWDKIARIVQTKNFKIFKTLFISFASS